MADKIKLAFEKNNSWGITISVDLHSSNPEFIRDADKIKEFVFKLCSFIDAKRVGDCVVVHFGEKGEIQGFSMVQLIETSLISGHFAEKKNNVYLDIFSCKYCNPKAVAQFCREFFQAKDCTVNYFFRN